MSTISGNTLTNLSNVLFMSSCIFAYVLIRTRYGPFISDRISIFFNHWTDLNQAWKMVSMTLVSSSFFINVSGFTAPSLRVRFLPPSSYFLPTSLAKNAWCSCQVIEEKQCFFVFLIVLQTHNISKFFYNCFAGYQSKIIFIVQFFIFTHMQIKMYYEACMFTLSTVCLCMFVYFYHRTDLDQIWKMVSYYQGPCIFHCILKYSLPPCFQVPLTVLLQCSRDRLLLSHSHFSLTESFCSRRYHAPQFPGAHSHLLTFCRRF